MAILIPPLHVHAIVAVRSAIVAIGSVPEDIRRMVQNDVKDHIESSGMGSIDQSAQLLIGIRLNIGEKRIGAQKVLNAIAMVGALL